MFLPRFYLIFLIFYCSILKNESIIIKGNNNKIKTYRPTTRYNQVIFGNLNNNSNEFNYIIRSKTFVEVSLVLNNKNFKEELVIECDQNLQKYFLIESNGNILNIKLDYSKQEEILQNHESNSIKLSKSEVNFIEQAEPIRILISRKIPRIEVKKNNFSEINIMMEKYSNQFDDTLSNINTKIYFDCNDRIIYNNETNADSATVEKFLLESNYKTKFLNVGICDESFKYFFEDHPNIMSFSAKKIKN
ncbi:unnamed protein product [Brachionus calyciflorus]|uniref:Uncharacterized protein n=1 Tax=Brachionus calyciflorus TaxID=104777 RepID=A0A813M717_9BILA|nr:unnamed protein product [Brachionus calyciflorus]